MEEKGLSVETADKIGTFVKERGHPLELLSKLKQEGSKFLENSASIDALNDLEILFKCLEKSKCIGKVVFDLSLARGLDYYTGVIYEAVFKGVGQVKLCRCYLEFLCIHFLYSLCHLTQFPCDISLIIVMLPTKKILQIIQVGIDLNLKTKL